MDKDNPACYECPKGKNGLHTWSRIVEEDTDSTAKLVGSMCLHCGLVLNKEHAIQVWSEN